jgi:uncharacterized membrane protein YphA (DoxX/SURF4 family)
MDVFTSRTVMDIIEALRSVGYLEAVTGGVFAAAFGISYMLLRGEVTSGISARWSPLASLAARVGLGAIFFVMGGLNGFLQFIPQHPSSLSQPCEPCAAFLQGILSTGYLFPFIKTVELLAGAMLLLGVWVPLASLMLAPVAANILLYHLVLNPAGLPIAIVIAVLYAAVVWSQRTTFLPLLRPRVGDAVA